MAKDSLARGARSATFSAGQAEKDEPIVFHGTVATEVDDAVCPHGINLIDGFCVLCKQADLREAMPEPRAPIDFSKYEPMNDRVLLRKIVEQDNRLVIEPDAFARIPNKAEVMAIPSCCDSLALGDVVLYGEYNAEDILVEGEKLLLVDVHDIRLKFKK